MQRRFFAKVLGLIAMVALVGSIAVAEEASRNGIAVANSFGMTVPPAGTEKLYNEAAGEMFPDLMGTSIGAQREFRRALPSIYSYSQTAHYQNRADAGSGAAYANIDSSNYYVVCPTTMCAPGSKWVMWDVPFMTNETRKRDDGYLGYKQTVSGFATGISRMLGESSAIGLAVGYDNRKMTGRDGYHIRNKADTFHAAIYGGTNIGNFFFDAYAGYSRSWNRSERSVGIDVNKANFNDTVLSAGLKASYVFILPSDIRITPSLGIDFSHVRSGNIRERSNGDVSNTVLAIGKSNYSNVAVPVMVSMNKTFSSGFLAFGGHDSLWTPEVRGGYVPQFGTKRADVRSTMYKQPGQNTFTAKSSKIADSYGTVGAGLKIKLRDKYIFGVDYDYSFASKYSNHSLTAMYGVSF